MADIFTTHGMHKPPVPAPVTQHQVAMAAAELYAHAPVGLKWMQSHRPRICPFEMLLQHIPSGAEVLDIGCGAGLFLGIMAHFGRITTGFGVDLSERAIAAAREMASRHSFSGLTFGHNGFPCAVPARQYDVVSAIDVLHHVPPSKQKTFVEDAARYVKPGGLLLIKDVAPRPRIWAACNSLHDLVVAREIVHYVDGDVIARWGIGIGFKVQLRRNDQRLWYNHQTLLFANAESSAFAIAKG